MNTRTHWKQKLTLSRLTELMNYDPATGIFTWRVSRRCVQAGSQAGTVNDRGYVAIKIDGILYTAHRLAWFWLHGTFPEHEIDHINRVRNDNRDVNLRAATPSQNKCNAPARRHSVSGIKGVSYSKDRNKYLAQIAFGGKNKNLGRFDTAEEAQRAYLDAAVTLHGEFAEKGAAK